MKDAILFVNFFSESQISLFSGETPYHFICNFFCVKAKFCCFWARRPIIYSLILIVKKKLLPTSTSLSTQIFPPHFSTNSLHTFSPSPLPFSLSVP